MANTTDLGKAVKKRLIDLERTQAWLIEQVKEKTGDQSFDTSWLHRILSGKIPASRGRGDKPGKAQVIREILGMEEQ